jgi:hypothetical protein
VLLRLAAREPALVEGDVLAERGVMMEEARQAVDDMFRYPFQLAFGAAFGDRGYGRSVGGLPETLATLDATQVREWHRTRFTPVRATVVAVGDLHGDADAFVALLHRTGLLDDARRWSGGRAILVQTGDYLDRGTQIRELLDLLMALETQAPAAGGKAIILMGNHEAMNAVGLVRDVAPAVFAGFSDAGSETRRAEAYAAHVALAEARRAALARTDPALPVPAIYAAPDREAWMAAHPPGMIEYIEAFGPAGAYGRWLRTRPVTARVGETVFVHGGLDPATAPKRLEQATEQAQKELARWDKMRAWMIDRGLATAAFTYREILEAGRSELLRIAADARNSGTDTGPNGGLPAAVTRHPLAELLAVDNWSLVAENGPLWFRGFATWSSEEGRMNVDALQGRYGRSRFVVGHTPLNPPRQMERFGDRVFLIDTGISSVYRSEGGRPSALEIRGGVYTAVYLDTRTVLYDPMASQVR